MTIPNQQQRFPHLVQLARNVGGGSGTTDRAEARKIILNATTLPELTAALTYGDRITRLKVLEIFRAFEHEEVLGMFRQVLSSDPCPIIRHEAAAYLGETRSLSNFDILVDRLHNDWNDLVRHEAALALAELGSYEAISHLERACDDPNDDVRASAEIALAHLTTLLNSESESHHHAHEPLTTHVVHGEGGRPMHRSPNGVSVRVCSMDDVENISVLIQAVIRECEYYNFAVREAEAQKYLPRAIATLIESGNGTVLGAYRDRRVVGFCVLESDAGTGWISWLGVDPIARRCGIAHRILSEIEVIGEKVGLHKLWCDCRVENQPSRSMLLNAGYNQVCVLNSHWYKEDFLLFEKTLGCCRESAS